MLPPSVKVYLAAEPTDPRRGHDGLCAAVRATLGRDPYSGFNKNTKPGRRTRAGCLAHTRRKIFECRELPEATEALELIRSLYRIAHDAKKAGVAGSDAHAEMRRTRGRLLHAKLLCWARRTRAADAPKTKFGNADGYVEAVMARIEAHYGERPTRATMGGIAMHLGAGIEGEWITRRKAVGPDEGRDRLA